MAKPIKTKAAGVTFDNEDGTNRQDIIRKYCNSGDWLDVRHEPYNPHSRNALGLWVRGGLIFRSWHKVGYIPQDDADRLRRRLDEGCQITARIFEVVGGEDGLSYGLRIDVFIQEPETKAGSKDQPPSVPLKTTKVRSRPASLPGSDANPPSVPLETTRPSIDPVELLSPNLVLFISKSKKLGILAMAEGLAFIGLGWLIQRLAGRPSDIFHLGIVLSIVGLGAFLIGVFSSFGDAQH